MIYSVCPVCAGDVSVTNMMAHILDVPDDTHLRMLIPVLMYTQKYAQTCYAFEIATMFSNDDTISDIGSNELKEDPVTMTAFISRCITALGFNRRRCISFNRKMNSDLVNTPWITMQDPKLLEKLKTLCTLSVPMYIRRNSPTYITPFTSPPESIKSNQNIVEITKIFRFAAGHHLPGHTRLCQYSHGHEWKLEVTVTDYVNPVTNMVIDFSDLKAIVNKNIIDILDHNYINDIIWNPTAENLCAWIFEELIASGLSNVSRVKLWEAADSFAVFEPHDIFNKLR